jgi:hypothetical protein
MPPAELYGLIIFESDPITTSKEIYRLKEDQAFSLSLELGRREKVSRHPYAYFLLPSVGGGGDLYCYCGEKDER